VLKLIFWSLLCINGALLAYSQGYLGQVKGNEHEPARAKAALNADQLTLVSAAVASAAAEEAAAAETANAQAAKASAPLSCFVLGSLSVADGRRFEAALAPLGLGERQSRQNVTEQDVTSHIVFIPPLGSKEAADRKAAELKALGVTSYFVMSDSSAMKWAISLGVFKSEAAAQALLAGLNKQGVHSARISARGPLVNKLAYQFRAVDAGTRARIEQLANGFDTLESSPCK
jgi:hypothetical protein